MIYLIAEDETKRRSLIKETITENLRRVQERIDRAARLSGRDPSAITIIGATKTVLVEILRVSLEVGITQFGENYVQEAKRKRAELEQTGLRPKWHLIGHLQTNKVTDALSAFDVIQTVDSIRLAEAIARRAEKQIPVMLEVNMGEEPTKYGFKPSDVASACRDLQRLPELSITGLMTIAPEVDDPEKVRPLFQSLRLLRDDLGLQELSMGVTGDFEVAIEEGATMVRIGRALFGARPG